MSFFSSGVSSVFAAILLLSSGAAPAFGDPPKASAASVAAPAGVPSGFEPYATRPDILSLTPKADATLGADWESLKRGHLEAVALLLEMYPDREIYFLARDSELLYDLARYEARKNPSLQSRLHLLNISRANMRAEHVKDYLAQEGISEATLRAGKKVLFVDTGFSGTIPRVLSEYFPADLHSHLETHLMSSSNSKHPSTRVFLTAINPAAPSMNPGSMHGSIVSYEHMPRYTDRSNQFARTGPDGKWEPLSLMGFASDGSVSKEKALAYMQDLLAYVSEPKNEALMHEMRALWMKLRSLSESSTTSQEQLVTELKAILERTKTATPSEAPFFEAAVRDFLDMRSTTVQGGAPEVRLSDLGLALGGRPGAIYSNKDELIKKYPDWAAVLENPVTGIQGLLDSGQWGKLGAILDTVKDEEVTRIIFQALGSRPPTMELRNFVKMLIAKDDGAIFQNLGTYTFSKPASAGLREELRLLIEKGGSQNLSGLAANVFSKPHTSEMREELQLLIEKADNATLARLASFTFSQPHTLGMKDELKLLIEKADPQTLQFLVRDTFPQPHTASMGDLLRRVIEKGNDITFRFIAMKTFSKPHTAGMRDLYKLLIEKGDSETLYNFASFVFSERHAEHMTDLIALLITRADDRTLTRLATHLIKSESGAKNDLLRMMVEKVGASGAVMLSSQFKGNFMMSRDPFIRALADGLEIPDPKERRMYLRQRLGTPSASTQTVSCIRRAID